MSERALEKELKKIDKKVKSELEPFLDSIRTKRANYELFKSAYKAFKKRHVRAFKVLDVLIKDFGKSPRGEMNALFAYLGLVEGPGNCIVDIIVMLLVASGRDFHIESRYGTPRIKHVASIEDLERERVPLTSKLNFLRDNGVTELSSIVDSKLRNRVAHLRFDVRKDTVFIKGKPAWELLMDNMLKLNRGLGAAYKALQQAAKEKGMIPKREK